MRVSRRLTVLGIPLVLAACDRTDVPPAADTEVPPAALPEEAQPPARPPAADVARTREHVVQLAALDDSGVTGVAEFESEGMQRERTEVEVELYAPQAGTTHQGRVHRGTCENIGEIVAPLEAVTIDDDRDGDSETSLDLPVTQFADGQHSVVYYEAGGQPGAPIACGEIPAAGSM